MFIFSLEAGLSPAGTRYLLEARPVVGPFLDASSPPALVCCTAGHHMNLAACVAQPCEGEGIDIPGSQSEARGQRARVLSEPVQAGQPGPGH